MRGALTWMEGPAADQGAAVIPVSDRGLLYGQGLFETFLLQGGRPFRLGEHLHRLEASAGVLELPLPAAGWHQRVTAAVAALGSRLGTTRARGRLTLTAGDVAGGDPAMAADGPPRLLLTVAPLPAAATTARPRTALIAGPPAPGGPGALTTHKTLGYLGNLLSLAGARRAGADEGLVQTAAGLLVGGARASLFVVRDGSLLTPGPAAGPLPGLTRRRLLQEVAPALGLAAGEADLTGAALAAAQEAFLTNALFGVVPLAACGACRWPAPGPVTARIIKAWGSLLAAGFGSE